MIAITSVTFGASLIAFGFSQQIWLSLPLLLVTGFSMMQQMSAGNMVIQTIVPEDKRGRVMSFYTLAFIGVGPFGSLLAGSVANALGARPTAILGGTLCLVASLWFARQLEEILRIVHPIYVRLGMMPGALNREELGVKSISS
jgi:MFS family permease